MATVRVELRERLMLRGGGLLHPGEVVALDAAAADDLVERGGARRVEAAPPVPPRDKMIGSQEKARPVRRK